MNIKCSECGLVNWSTEIECKRCQALLTVQAKRAEQLIAYEPEDTPLLSKGLTILMGLLVCSVLAGILSHALGLQDSDLAKIVAILLILLGLLLTFVSHIWLLVRIFEQSIAWGLGSIFIPFVGLVAVIKFWENTKRSFVAQIVCAGIVISAALIAVK